MSYAPFPEDAFKLATDLPILLRAGKHGLVAQYALEILKKPVLESDDPVLKLELLHLIIAILGGDRVDYATGGGYSPQEPKALYTLIKARFRPTHPLWTYIDLPKGETLPAEPA